MSRSASDAPAAAAPRQAREEGRSRWIAFPAPSAHAATTLFCFPYAGGSGAVFRDWPAALPAVNVAVVQLPGRAGRFTEPPIARLEPLREAIVDAMAPHLDRPFALFGHSVGALVAFEVARALEASGGPAPDRLLLSAYPGPRLPVRDVCHDLPTDQFLAKLRELDGTPSEVFESPDLVEVLLPALRADFAVSETYEYRPGPPLACPLEAFLGTEDTEIRREDMLSWGQETTGRFRLHMVPGGHFLLHSHQTRLLELVAALLDPSEGAHAEEGAAAEVSR